MENPIAITLLNDFIFCPISIYFHSLDYETEKLTYQDSYQLNGTASHKNCDEGTYSDKKNILQGVSVYCEKYDLSGKIDTFDAEKGILTERKRKIIRIYDGYVFQLYAQYFSLIEMGYEVKELRLYSMSDNKVYKVEKPEDDEMMLSKFESTIHDLKSFNMQNFKQTNIEKCENCIYAPLCSFSLNGEEK